MRLTDLEPRWIGPKAGLTFDCPGLCCAGATGKKRLFVLFEDPALPLGVVSDRRWYRTGTTFEDLTLTPSLDWSSIGHWHGFIRDGEVV
jgi:hypothetical protein